MKYNPIVPSSLLSMDDGIFDAAKKDSSDFSLKSGVVVATYEVDDKLNISKEYIEYDVMTVEQDRDMGTSSVVYKRCMLMEGFGSLSDFFEFRRRAPKKNPKKEKEPGVLNGSTVLILCLSGNRTNGIIIGALKHPKRKTKLTKDKGHHLEGEFNGVNWQIDKDGSFKITFKTASDNDGKYKESEGKIGGTHIHMDKDGGVDINANLKGADETYMRMDKKNKDVGLKAGRHVGFTAKKNLGLIAEANITAKATADLLADAGGSMTLKSAGAFNINAGAALDVKSASVNLISDGSVKVKGTTVQISAPSIQLGDGGTPAVIMTTQVFAIGNLGAPILGTLIGPFSSGVMIAP